MSLPSKPRVGVIGLGLMGTAIAERLLEHGYEVWVWNRTRTKAELLLARGARWSDNPLSLCERVIVSLYTSDVVATVLDQMHDGLRAGQIVIDTTTSDPDQSVILNERLATHDVQYLDAPISGSSQQTRLGQAMVMVGGERGAYETCHDLWTVLGQNTAYLGPSGSAAKMKLVSNLVLGLNRAALAEGLVFAQAIGVEPTAALEVLRSSMAYSRVMEVKGAKMLTSDFAVQARLSQHLKDVRLILASGVPLPLSETHRQLLEQAEQLGLGELDNSAIIQAVRAWQRTPKA